MAGGPKKTQESGLKKTRLVYIIQTHTPHTMSTFDNNAPIKPADFDPTVHIPYAKIKSHPNGGKYIWAKAKVKAPTMRLAFPVNENVDDKTGRTKYDMAMSFLGSDTNEKLGAFRGVLEAFDQYNIDWIQRNSVELFSEDLTAPAMRLIVADRYSPMVKPAKKAEFSPTLKIKLMTNYNTGKNEFQVFGNKKDPVSGAYPDLSETIWSEEGGLDLTCFQPKNEYATLIEYTGMWVVGKKVYPSWKLVQCQPKTSSIQDKAFALGDSDDEEEAPVESGVDELAAQVAAARRHSEVAAGADSQGAFDDEDA